MKLVLTALSLIWSSQILSSCNAIDARPGVRRNMKSPKAPKAPKTPKAPKSPKSDSATCTRETWSIVSPNSEWDSHIFNPQVWYHTLEDIHSLWQEGYFDYVLDIRPLQDTTLDSGLLLEGWETLHIPGSYPISVFPPDTPVEEVDMLVDFTSTNVCKDSRIFVHCWSGISGNRVAQTLIDLGFTNVHAAGPEGSAGMWNWRDAGYDVVYDDVFDASEPRLQPACMNACASAHQH